MREHDDFMSKHVCNHDDFMSEHICSHVDFMSEYVYIAECDINLNDMSDI